MQNEKDDFEPDYGHTWLCGIYDAKKKYGMLLHAGNEDVVRATYNAMLRGGKSSGLNTECLKLLSPNDWTRTAVEMKLDSKTVYNKLLKGDITFDEFFL